MTEHEEHQLQKSLKSWHYTPERDPDFKRKVHHRIHEQFFTQNSVRSQTNPIVDWIKEIFPHPAYAAAMLVAVVVSSVLLTLKFPVNSTSETGIPASYQVVTDPAQTAKLMMAQTTGFQSLPNKPALSRESFEQALYWIEKEVNLDTDQKTKFQRVHERFFNQYELLCNQLFQLENEYRKFERDRVAGHEIDLFSVYANFQQQKSIYQQTIELQQNLIQEVSGLLTPQQQGAFGQLFHQTLQSPLNPPSARLEHPKREWQI